MVGRDPGAVKAAEYIRVCDDDVDAARRALVRAALGYVLGPRGPTACDRRMGYRAHGYSPTTSQG